MNLLLDTTVLLRWVGDLRISDSAIAAVADPANPVFVSAVTAWEISIKRALGKLVVDEDVYLIERLGFEPLPFSHDDARAAGELPPFHPDPFDRMLVAQAIAKDLVLVTQDSLLARYGVKSLLA